MDRFIVKLEKIDFNYPIYREPVLKELSCCLMSEAEEYTPIEETREEKVYRLEKIVDALGKFSGLYVDDKSFKIIQDLMSLSNEQIEIVCEEKTRKLAEDFNRELFHRDMEREEIYNEIRKLPWYKRLLNKF